MEGFQGKVAVITGAGRGIGRGIARRCAAEGMRVVLAGIGLKSLTRTEADLQAMGATALVVRTDVRQAGDVKRLALATLEAFGGVHLLVNNAGVLVIKSIWESSTADWQWVMGVNFWGVLHGIRAFLPIMMTESDNSHIVNVSSMNGVIRGVAGAASYSVSKQAVVGLTESLYFELAQRAPQIKVSVYVPGQVDTDLASGERNRPNELANDPDSYALTDEERQMRDAFREQLAAAISIDESADILFEGLKQGKLYIGPQGFQNQHPWLGDAILQRATNILEEINPTL